MTLKASVLEMSCFWVLEILCLCPDRVGRVHFSISFPKVVCTWYVGGVGGIPWFDLCLGSGLVGPNGPETFLVCTIVIVGLLGIFAEPLVLVLLSGLDSFAILCAWRWAGLMIGIVIGCGVLPVLGLAPFWGSPLELAPEPELGCVL